MIQSNEITRFLKQYAVDAIQIDKMDMAGNNQLYIIKTDSHKFVLKKYYPDQNHRYDREITFLNFLSKNNIKNVPKVFFSEKSTGLTLMSWVDGNKIKDPSIKNISEAAQFIEKINSLPRGNNSIMNAMDSGFSYIDHYKNIVQRVNILKNHLNYADKKTVNLIEHIDKNLKLHSDLKSAYKVTTTILSPSDFGFHNILMNDDKLFFLDFEYSGLDDPIKLACDFFLQPKIPVPIKYLDIFVTHTHLISNLSKDEYLYRFNTLFKINALKWACIALNILDPNLLEKRFLSSGKDKSSILNEQLEQAEKFFNRYLALTSKNTL